MPGDERKLLLRQAGKKKLGIFVKCTVDNVPKINEVPSFSIIQYQRQRPKDVHHDVHRLLGVGVGPDECSCFFFFGNDGTTSRQRQFKTSIIGRNNETIRRGFLEQRTRTRDYRSYSPRRKLDQGMGIRRTKTNGMLQFSRSVLCHTRRLSPVWI